MRHRIKGRKLNRSSSHRKSLLQNLALELINHKTIQTTLPKAKELKKYIEPLVTIARKNTLSAKKLLLSKFRNKIGVVNNLIEIATKHYQKRNGGYTRVLKSGFRKGDNAPIGLVQFVGLEPKIEDLRKKLKETKISKPD